MNSTLPTPTINPNHMIDTSGIFLIIGLSFMIMTCITVARIISNHSISTIEPQIATHIMIEIPIAVSISIQTVDNEHIGSVL
jgi:hypothetical protein